MKRWPCFRTGLFAWILALVVGSPFIAVAQRGAPEFQTEVLFSADVLPAGGAIQAAVRVQIPEGWHANAHKPLENFLIPTTLTIEPPAGLRVVKIAYPEAKRLKLSFSDADVAVYEKTFTIGVAFEADAALAPGDYAAPAKLRYQACNDTQCAPPKTIPVAVTLKVAPQGQAAKPLNADVFAALAIELGAPEASGATASATPSSSITSQASPAPSAEAGAWRKDLDAFAVANVGSFMTPSQFIRFLDDAEAGKGRSAASLFAGRGVAAIILLTLLGGLMLNLTPCVLPLIPINVAIIGAGARAGSKSRGFALGMAYGLGIAAVYGALGLIVVLAGATFGAINASPWFNLVISVLFVALALAMFDVFLIDFTRFQTLLGSRNKGGGFAPAFVMGGVSALLAGACVAPVVIAVLVFAQDLFAKGQYAGLALPFVLGMGMALPWPFAGAGLSFLPKPGRWMDRVKHVFGVFILALAAYYGYTAYSLFTSRAEVASPPPAVVAESGGWLTSLNEGLARARAEGKPVVIDFWATWCKNCRIMDETTFRDAELQKRLEKYIKIKYQAETPDDPPHKEVLDRFRAVGLPTIVVLTPKP